jgi:hypothetical protein
LSGLSSSSSSSSSSELEYEFTKSQAGEPEAEIPDTDSYLPDGKRTRFERAHRLSSNFWSDPVLILGYSCSIQEYMLSLCLLVEYTNSVIDTSAGIGFIS